MPVTPKFIKDSILRACYPYIGTYELSNGTVIQAIAVGDIPDDTKVTGVEIRIPIVPRISTSFLAGTTYTFQKQSWDIHILIRDGNNKTNFFEATQRMLKYFTPHCSYVDIPRGDMTRSYNHGVLTICVPHLDDTEYSLFP
jgi:hypothetical protein